MRRMSWIRGLLALGVGWGVSAGAMAQTPAPMPWPERPVRVIVPFPASGATDLIARVVTQRVSQNIGQQVIVDNRPGAGGTIGSAEAAKAAPDGYTLLLTTSSTHAISPHLVPRLAYNAARDFTPVAHLADAASVLLVTPSLPVKSVPELVAYARAHPGKLNYATSGNGTIVHLNTAAFSAHAGIEMTHVPYKGTALSIPDLTTGQVHVLFDAIPTGMPHVKSGRLRALGVTSEKRSALAPELPTLAESGLPGYASVTWFGLYLPAGAPAALVERIHQAFTRAVQDPEVVASLTQLGVEPAAPGSPAKFATMVQIDSDRWAFVIRQHKIAVD